jgi:peptidyl-prolyl cis-trans isomerase B (cyclophilin B)
MSQNIVLLNTTQGDIKLLLYDDTPIHKANFIKLVRDGYYDGMLFHRVIPNFMIQTGDPNSKNASPDQALGNGGPGYTLPAEFNSLHYHKKGALASARLSDAVNPARESSGSQFYIVVGQVFSNAQLDALERTNRHEAFTEDQIKIYTNIGGTPHLDNAYTVFGEVLEGIDTIEKISTVPTDSRNRPLADIKIIKASVLE